MGLYRSVSQNFSSDDLMQPSAIIPCSVVKRTLLLPFFSLGLLQVAQVLRYRKGTANEPVVWQAERVYISVLIWNNEDLMRSRCISDLLDMVRVLGRDNVFNSVYDSGSWDNSKCALTELDLLLENYGVERNINLSNTTHLDEMAVLDVAFTVRPR
jgi:hypothetical protein